MNIKHNLVKAALFVTCIISVTASHACSDTTCTDNTSQRAIAAGAEHRNEQPEGPIREGGGDGNLSIRIQD